MSLDLIFLETMSGPQTAKMIKRLADKFKTEGQKLVQEYAGIRNKSKKTKVKKKIKEIIERFFNRAKTIRSVHHAVSFAPLEKAKEEIMKQIHAVDAPKKKQKKRHKKKAKRTRLSDMMHPLPLPVMTEEEEFLSLMVEAKAPFAVNTWAKKRSPQLKAQVDALYKIEPWYHELKRQRDEFQKGADVIDPDEDNIMWLQINKALPNLCKLILPQLADLMIKYIWMEVLDVPNKTIPQNAEWLAENYIFRLCGIQYADSVILKGMAGKVFHFVEKGSPFYSSSSERPNWGSTRAKDSLDRFANVLQGFSLRKTLQPLLDYKKKHPTSKEAPGKMSQDIFKQVIDRTVKDWKYMEDVLDVNKHWPLAVSAQALGKKFWPKTSMYFPDHKPGEEKANYKVAGYVDELSNVAKAGHTVEQQILQINHKLNALHQHTTTIYMFGMTKADLTRWTKEGKVKKLIAKEKAMGWMNTYEQFHNEPTTLSEMYKEYRFWESISAEMSWDVLPPEDEEDKEDEDKEEVKKLTKKAYKCRR